MAFVSAQGFSYSSDSSDSDRSSSPEADDPNYALSGPHIHNEMTLESKWPYSKVFGSSYASTCPQVIETTSDHVCFLVRSIPEPEGKFYSLGIDTVGHKHNHVLLFQFVLVSDWSHSRFQTKDYIVHITLQEPNWLHEKFLRVEQVEEWHEIAKKENVTFLMNLKYNVDHDFICHEPGHVKSVSCRLAKKRFKKCPPIKMSLDSRLLPIVPQKMGTFPGMQKVREERGEQNTALVRLPPFDTLLKKQHIGEFVRTNMNWLMSKPSSMIVDQSFYLNPGSLIRDGQYMLPIFSRLAGQINARFMPQEFAGYQGVTHHLFQSQSEAQEMESLPSTSYDTGGPSTSDTFISRLAGQVSSNFRPQEFAANRELHGATKLLQSQRGAQETDSFPSTSYDTGAGISPETIISRLASQISVSYRPKEFAHSTSDTIVSRLCGEANTSFNPQEFASNREIQRVTHHLPRSRRKTRDIEEVPSTSNDTGDPSTSGTFISKLDGQNNDSFMPQEFAPNRQIQEITRHPRQSQRGLRKAEDPTSSISDIAVPSISDTIFSRISGELSGNFRPQEFTSNLEIEGVAHHLQSQRGSQEIESLPSTSKDAGVLSTSNTIFSRLPGQISASFRSQECAPNRELQGISHHLRSQRGFVEIDEVPSISNDAGAPSTSATIFSRSSTQLNGSFKPKAFSSSIKTKRVTHRLPRSKKKARDIKDVASTSCDTGGPSNSDTFISKLSGQVDGSFGPHEFPKNRELQWIAHDLQSQRGSREIDEVPPSSNDTGAPLTSDSIFSRLCGHPNGSFKPQAFASSRKAKGVTHRLPQSEKKTLDIKDVASTSYDTGGPTTSDTAFSRLLGEPSTSFKPQEFASNREIQGVTHHLPQCRRKARDIIDVTSTSTGSGGPPISDTIFSRLSGQYNGIFRPQEFAPNCEIQEMAHHLQSQRDAQNNEDPPTGNDAGAQSTSDTISRLSDQFNGSFRPHEFAPSYHSLQSQRGSRDDDKVQPSSNDSGAEDLPLDLKKVAHPPAALKLTDVPYAIPRAYSWAPPERTASNWTPSISGLHDTPPRAPSSLNATPRLPRTSKTHRPPVRRRARRRIIIACGEDRFLISSKVLEDASPVVKAFMTYWTPLPDPNGDIYLEISGVTSIALENLLKYLTHDSVNRGVMRSTHMKELTRKLKIDLNYT